MYVVNSRAKLHSYPSNENIEAIGEFDPNDPESGYKGMPRCQTDERNLRRGGGGGEREVVRQSKSHFNQLSPVLLSPSITRNSDSE